MDELPFTADEMNHLSIGIDDNKDAYAFMVRHNDTAVVMPIYHQECVNPKARFLLQSAPYMYKALTEQIKGMQVLIESMERFNADFKKATGRPAMEILTRSVDMLTGMQNGAFLAQRCAQLGCDAVSKEITKQG